MSELCSGTNIENADELSLQIRRYLYLSDNSYNILKYMSDNINEPLSSRGNSPVEDSSIEPLNKSATLQDGRAPSPASISSLASGRRLEWDSGADVGYAHSSHPNSLSTLERIALGGFPESLIRTDPEGTSSSVVNSRNVTHKTVVKKDSSRVSRVQQSDDAVSSPREVTGVINLSVFSNNEAVSIKSMKSKSDSDNDSMEVPLPAVDGDTIPGNSALRSAGECGNHSKLRREVHPLDSKINDKASHEREISLTPLANEVPARSGSSSSLASTIIPHNTSGPRPLTSQKSKSNEKGVQIGGTLNARKPEPLGETSSLGKYFSNEDEIEVVALNSGLPIAENNHKTSQKEGRESIGNSSFDCANSFEYFPGETYDRSGEGSSKMKENFRLNAKNPRRICNALSNDLEDNIGRIREVLHDKKVGSEERRILIKQLVDRIVGSKYSDDDEKSSSSKSSESHDSVIKVLPAKSDKCLSAVPTENIEVNSKKSYVPYRPVPGGRIYHVATYSNHKSGYHSSTSCCESDDSRPKTYFLPVDRIRVTQHSSSSSDKRGSSPVFSKSSEKRNFDSHKGHKPRTNVVKDNSVTGEYRKQEYITAAELKNHGGQVDRDKPCCSRECAMKRHWWSPVTKSERSRLSVNVKNKPNPLFNYTERERANQLHWIKNEIQHLSSLAQLLEDCAVIKSETTTSVEDQMSILSSLASKKETKNVVNSTDRYLSSSRSTPIEDPISATMHWNRNMPKKKPSLSPPVHDTSLQIPSPRSESTQTSESSSSQALHSKSSSRIESNERHTLRTFGHKNGDKKSEAYVITFEEVSPDKKCEKQKEMDSRKSLKEVRLKVPTKQSKNVREAIKTHGFKSLQEQLEVCHPSFIKSTEERQKCLEELARLRSLRQMTRRKLLHFTLNAWEDPLANKNHHLKQNMSKPKSAPSAPKTRHSGKSKESNDQICPRMKKHRIFPEMQKKEAERIKKKNQQTNRIMAELFARRLQKKVLHGAVSLSNSVSVISSL